MRVASTLLLVLLTSCEPKNGNSGTSAISAQEVEIAGLARASLKKKDEDRARMLAHLLFNVLRPGMTQREVTRAVGTSEWIEDCKFAEIRGSGWVPIRHTAGSGESRTGLNLYSIVFYPKDTGGNGQWGLWFGLRGVAGGSNEQVSKFFRDQEGAFSDCQLDEIAVFHISADGKETRHVTRFFDGGIELWFD
jgi:hypothetical protein